MRITSLLLVPIVPLTLAARSATSFHNVRVFDGERAVSNRDVLVQDGKVARVGTGLAAPHGATMIEGAGKTGKATSRADL